MVSGPDAFGSGNCLRPRDPAVILEQLEPRLMLSAVASSLADAGDAGLYLPGYVIRPDDSLAPAAMTPATDLSSSLINLDNFRADPRFAGIDGSGYSIAILDTGIDVDHPFFGADLDANGVADRIVYQHDFADYDSDASDHDGHGSNVASIAASEDATYTGMAPGANLVILKVFSDDMGSGGFGPVASALSWVITNAEAYNIVALNMSLGDSANYNTPQSQYGLSDELATLAEMGVIAVAAAGNAFFEFGEQGVSYPAADPNCIAVSAVWDGDNGGPHTWSSGAIDYSSGVDRLTSFTQRHETMTDIFAPGAMITGAGLDGGTVDYAGTSQASPHIAGLAVLAQQLAVETIGRTLTLQEFRNVLQGAGDTIYDGDDEDDNVPNTNTYYTRIDAVALGEAILAMDQPGSIAGTVWLDKDSDGAIDAGEPGMAGWTVYLDADDDGELDAGEVSTVTAAGGTYEFADLPADLYTVRQVERPGFTQTAPLGGEYEADAIDFVFEDIAATGASVMPGADDDFYHLTAGLLDGFEFDFYGENYDELFFSTNGLITFGQGDFGWDQFDLSDQPQMPAIAPLWDDLESVAESGFYWQVLGSGDEQRLVIQWDNVEFRDGGNILTGTITFQAVLYERDGAVQFNYLDLETYHFGAEGADATVGIKAAGEQGPDRLLLSFYSGPNIYVGTGKSTRIAVVSERSHTVGVAGAVVADVNFGNWANWTIEGDFNGDGAVTGADYVLWAASFGAADTDFAVGSHNHDGLVTGADYVIWADHFGATADASIPQLAIELPQPDLSLFPAAIQERF